MRSADGGPRVCNNAPPRRRSLVRRATTDAALEARRIDTQRRVVRCEDTFRHLQFDVKYDVLIVAAGCKTHTFGTPGVAELERDPDAPLYFLKHLYHARAIRQRVLECFERASSPAIDDAEKARRPWPRESYGSVAMKRQTRAPLGPRRHTPPSSSRASPHATHDLRSLDTLLGRQLPITTVILSRRDSSDAPPNDDSPFSLSLSIRATHKIRSLHAVRGHTRTVPRPRPRLPRSSGAAAHVRRRRRRRDVVRVRVRALRLCLTRHFKVVRSL